MAESDKDKEPLEDSIYSDATHDRFNAVEAAALAGRPFPEFEDEVAAEELEDLREFYALAIEATRSPTEEKETADQPVDDFAELKRLFEETTRYELLGYIGHGGFGWVYQGQSALGRRVAIKVLGPDFKKCIQEGQAAARVDSDFIVTIHEYGELPNGRMFLVMDLVQGESEDASLLGYIGPETPPPPEETILRWMKEVSEGMAAAAAKGITHRDLKPANILIDINRAKDEGGRARIGDFGLARIENDETPAAGSSGEVAGDTDSAGSLAWLGGLLPGSDAIYKSQTVGNHGFTPEYCSPEQAKEPRDATQQSDIYCFGATFYHLATGALPTGNMNRGEIHQAKSQPVKKIDLPLRPRKLNPDLSGELCDLLMSCLENDPARRPATFEAVRKELRKIEAPLPRRNPFHEELLEKGKHALRAGGNPEEAKLYFSKAIGGADNCHEARYGRGLAYEQEGKNFLKMADEYPDGNLRSAIASFEMAIADFERALELKADHPHARIRLDQTRDAIDDARKRQQGRFK